MTEDYEMLRDTDFLSWMIERASATEAA